MSHWGFVAAAYGIAVAGTLALLVASFAAMRRAEAEADAMKGER
jgi:hypothetical protein